MVRSAAGPTLYLDFVLNFVKASKLQTAFANAVHFSTIESTSIARHNHSSCTRPYHLDETSLPGRQITFLCD